MNNQKWSFSLLLAPGDGDDLAERRGDCTVIIGRGASVNHPDWTLTTLLGAAQPIID